MPLCGWKIEHLSFLCIFECFSSLSFQFLNITAPQLKEGVCKKPWTQLWDTNNPLSPCLCSWLCGSRALVLAQMGCCGTDMELDVQGQIQVTLMAQILLCRAGKENSTERTGQEQGEERLLTFSPLPLGSRLICRIWQFRGRKESWVKFPTPATQWRPWSLYFIVVLWWVKCIEKVLQPTAVRLSTYQLHTVENNEI